MKWTFTLGFLLLLSGTLFSQTTDRYAFSVFVPVEENDTVLVVLDNSKLSITTYGIALASGQKGDLITVENIKSKKTFKAIVLDEKKVNPLANM